MYLLLVGLRACRGTLDSSLHFKIISICKFLCPSYVYIYMYIYSLLQTVNTHLPHIRGDVYVCMCKHELSMNSVGLKISNLFVCSCHFFAAILIFFFSTRIKKK